MGNSRSISSVSDLVFNEDTGTVEMETDTDMNTRRYKTSLHYKLNYP